MRATWTAVAIAFVVSLAGLQSTRPQAPADDRNALPVGVQPDGRIVVPTNQVLKPAGEQVTFPGRPVDLALADGGKTLVVKNKNNLVFIDAATGEVEQTLTSPVGFSVVGLAVRRRPRLRQRRQGPRARRRAGSRTARTRGRQAGRSDKPAVGGARAPGRHGLARPRTSCG